jgi:lipoyl(octanoyl) transferase
MDKLLWRLILDTRSSAAKNMAVDEAIFLACTNRESPPTLRLYDWERPAVSLGCFQQTDKSELDVEYCRNAGIDLVRRPTGGRAVLHGHDLTFSISLPQDILPAGSGSIIGSHRWLMSGILSGLRSVGMDAELGSDKPVAAPRSSNADCFAHIAGCDIRSGSSKLVGSAQMRRSGGLLEQGSIPCSSPAVDACRVFRGRAYQIAESGLSRMPRGNIEQAIVHGFGQALGVELQLGRLSDTEIRRAAELEKKYSSEEWNNIALKVR